MTLSLFKTQPERELDAALRERKRARKARANSARQGVSSYWAKSGARCREMFGL